MKQTQKQKDERALKNQKEAQEMDRNTIILSALLFYRTSQRNGLEELKDSGRDYHGSGVHPFYSQIKSWEDRLGKLDAIIKELINGK